MKRRLYFHDAVRLELRISSRSCRKSADALIEEKIFGQTEPLPPSNSMLRKLQQRSNMCNQPSSLIFNRREVKRKKKKERERMLTTELKSKTALVSNNSRKLNENLPEKHLKKRQESENVSEKTERTKNQSLLLSCSLLNRRQLLLLVSGF
jgi:hypothetical protein